MRLAGVPFIGAILLCTTQSVASAEVDSAATGRRDLVVPGRSIVVSRLGIVAASQPLAARAGVEPPRSGTFGWGQAGMRDRNGVHWGASEPRHDGAAVPPGAPVVARRD